MKRLLTIAYKGGSYCIAANVRERSDLWIVFVHGWGCRKESFDRVFEQHSLDSLTLCAFDLLGYGESDKPAGFTYTMEDHAEITNLVIRAIGAKSTYVVGHSMGGLAGVLAAQNAGVPIHGLLSAEGNLVAADAGSKIRALAIQPYKLFESVGFRALQVAMAASRDAGTRAWAEWWGTASPEAVYKNAKSIVEWSDSGKLLTLFRSIRHRLYLSGDKSDKASTISRLSHDEMVILGHSRHFMMIDNPVGFSKVIAESVREI
jgi:pimeloyl-ACP methyl ester carboxylesterase